MNKAIKYRLYPTEKQAVIFAKTFGCCRKIYNLMLADKIANYALTKSFGMQTPAQYKAAYPYLREVDSLALANAQIHLQQAFANRFKKKSHFGFPKFKSKRKSKRRYTTNNQKNSIEIYENAIKLPKIGKVEAVIHRLPEGGWKLKAATVSQESDGKYYASVLFEYDATITPVLDPKNAIGLDYKSDGLYMDSNGHIGTNHEFFRESQKKLAKAQKRLARRKGSQKGESKSKNFIKQSQRIGRIHRHIANQRLDNLHKISTEIANRYDIVCVEDLNMKALSNRKFGNGKATLDNGYGRFLSILEYKLADRGKYFVRVDKWYPSSQLCSRCGKRHSEMKNLSIRTMQCDCGYTEDRDINAALNILNEGLRILREAA